MQLGNEALIAPLGLRVGLLVCLLCSGSKGPSSDTPGVHLLWQYVEPVIVHIEHNCHHFARAALARCPPRRSDPAKSALRRHAAPAKMGGHHSGPGLSATTRAVLVFNACHQQSGLPSINNVGRRVPLIR